MNKNFIATGLLLLGACARVNIDQKAKVYEGVFKNNLTTLFDDANKQALYPKREAMRDIAGKCLVDNGCNATLIKQWVGLLPSREYFDHVADVQKRMLAGFETAAGKIRAEATKKTAFLDQLIDLQRLTLVSIISSKVFTTTIQFPQLARQLENHGNWSKSLMQDFAKRVRGYVCAPLFGLVDLKIRTTTLADKNVRDLLGSFEDYSDFNKSYDEYKKKGDTLYRVNPSLCNSVKLAFSEDCLVETLKPVKDRQLAEDQLVETYGKKVLSSKACAK